MPWQETNPVLERKHLAQDCASGAWTMTELCTRYGISRNTGYYKWLERFAPPECPGPFEVRKVSGADTFRLHSGQHFLSKALNDE